MKRSVQVHLCLLVLSALFLYGCAEPSEQQSPEIDLDELNEIVPEQFPIVADQIWRFDVNGDGANEWAVLYHVDKVKTTHWYNDRSNLVTQTIYSPQSGYYCNQAEESVYDPRG